MTDETITIVVIATAVIFFGLWVFSGKQKRKYEDERLKRKNELERLKAKAKEKS